MDIVKGFWDKATFTIGKIWFLNQQYSPLFLLWNGQNWLVEDHIIDRPCPYPCLLGLRLRGSKNVIYFASRCYRKERETHISRMRDSLLNILFELGFQMASLFLVGKESTYEGHSYAFPPNIMTHNVIQIKRSTLPRNKHNT